MQRFLERYAGFLPALVALTLPVVFLPSAADTYILPRVSILLGGTGLGLGLALLVQRSGSLGELRRPLVAAIAAALLAFVFSVSWPLSLAGSYTRYESLPVRLAYLGIMAASIWLLRTRAQRDAVVAAFVFGTSVASLEALQQAFAHVSFRPDGNLGNANLLAALIAMAIPLAIDRARRVTLFVGPWAAAVVVMAAGLVTTTSRSGGLGVVAGCLALLTFAVPRRFAIGVGLGSAVAVAAAVEFVLVSPLRALNDDPASLRLNLWQDGLRLLAARPLTGWGEDATGLTFGRFLSRDYAGLVTFDRVHSGPIDVAVTQGVIGLAVLAWLLFVVFRAAWRGRQRTDVAGLTAALVGFTVWVFFNFDWAPVTGVFWLLVGTLWSAVHVVEGEAPAAAAPPPARHGATWTARYGRFAVHVPHMWGGLAAAVLAILAVPLAVFPLLADSWYLSGRADLSIRFDPLQAQYHWALGTVPEMQRAADLGETDPGLYVQLGDGYLKAGDRASARKAYERALEIDPYYSPASQRLAALGG